MDIYGRKNKFIYNYYFITVMKRSGFMSGDQLKL